MRLVVILVVAACSHGSPPRVKPAPQPSATTPAAPAGIAPQLFTVEQLRAGNPQGRTIEFRMEADGKPTTIEHWEFSSVDAEQATIHSTTRDEAGKVLADETGSSK